MASFTIKDLAQLVPDENPGDPASLRHTQSRETTEPLELPKPQYDPTKKVTRYRAGQVPQFATGYEEERGFVTVDNRIRKGALPVKRGSENTRRRVEAQIVTSTVTSGPRRPRAEPEVVQSASTRAPPSKSEHTSQPASKDPRIVPSALEDSSSEDDDEAIDNRRQMLRSKLLSKQSEPAKSLPEPSQHQRSPQARDETESSESSGSEWETDTSESEEEDGAALLKPVFVPKMKRSTVKSAEQLEAEEERRYQEQLEKQKARKSEARELVAKQLQLEKESAQAADETDTEMPDDTDGVDPDEEYRQWELRELRRLKRDRDLREQQRLEAEETLRRRNMTEEERRQEDEKLMKNKPKEKKKWKFMQKYYHKGAFYQDETSVKETNDVRKRDASGATLEDKFNKEMMPKVMQVKNFGKAGRTKYTHLLDQDTTSRDSLWNRRDEIRDKYSSKISGVRDLDRSLTKKQKTGDK